jgi:hypothetical protein
MAPLGSSFLSSCSIQPTTNQLPSSEETSLAHDLVFSESDVNESVFRDKKPDLPYKRDPGMRAHHEKES